MTNEEIKKILLDYCLQSLSDLKPLLEKNEALSQAYDEDRHKVWNAADELFKELKTNA